MHTIVAALLSQQGPSPTLPLSFLLRLEDLSGPAEDSRAGRRFLSACSPSALDLCWARLSPASERGRLGSGGLPAGQGQGGKDGAVSVAGRRAKAARSCQRRLEGGCCGREAGEPACATPKGLQGGTQLAQIPCSMERAYSCCKHAPGVAFFALRAASGWSSSELSSSSAGASRLGATGGATGFGLGGSLGAAGSASGSSSRAFPRLGSAGPAGLGLAAVAVAGAAGFDGRAAGLASAAGCAGLAAGAAGARAASGTSSSLSLSLTTCRPCRWAATGLPLVAPPVLPLAGLGPAPL